MEFVSFVLDDAQRTWQQILPGYRKAKLVIFAMRRRRRAAWARRRAGRSTVPRDEKVYLDLGFFDELRTRFGASGDFAEAYVITHEIGHHVQRLRGIEGQVRQLQESRPGQAKALSVRLELQADCYAGVWGHSTAQRNILEQGDVESALNAAASIGDDRIQQMSGRAVAPGVVHARVVAGTRHVVQARAGQRGSQRLRHLRGDVDSDRPVS